MIITCPGCHTRFQIAPASLGGAGRNVRCSSCGERWFVERYSEPPSPPPLALTTQPSLAAAPAPAPPPRHARLVPWLAATVLVLLLAAMLAGRNEIAARLPATIPIYQRLGLSLELPLGIELRALSSERRVSGGDKVLVVSGEIANISGGPRAVPPLRVAWLDAGRRELDHGQFDPPEAALAAGRATRFVLDLGAPPPEARDVTVTFAMPP